jgi:hypothetical protein
MSAYLSVPGRLWRVSALAAVALFLARVEPGQAAQAASQAASQPASKTFPEAFEWRTVVKKFAQEHFKNPAWGYSHCARDYRLARELAAADHVELDDDVLYAAAYLHDLAEFEPWEKSGVDHADEAAAIVDTVLRTPVFP